MKSNRTLYIITTVLILIVGYVWWVTIQDGKRILSGDRGKNVIYSSDTTDNTKSVDK